jgi:hypothetical protein
MALHYAIRSITTTTLRYTVNHMLPSPLPPPSIIQRLAGCACTLGPSLVRYHGTAVQSNSSTAPTSPTRLDSTRPIAKDDTQNQISESARGLTEPDSEEMRGGF